MGNFIVRDVRLKGLSNKMDDLSKVCFWALAMADGLIKITKDEKDAGLRRIAQCFEITFPSKDNRNDGKKITVVNDNEDVIRTIDGNDSKETETLLNWNPNEHHVHSQLYGDEAMFNSPYATIDAEDRLTINSNK